MVVVRRTVAPAGRDDDEVHRYERAFDHIAGMALSVEDSREVLVGALERC